MQASDRNEFWSKSYRENIFKDFSVGHWIAESAGDKVKPHIHTHAHIMFITGEKFETQAQGLRTSNNPLMIYNPPETFHCDRFVSISGSFFTISVRTEVIQDLNGYRLPQIPTAIFNPRAHSIIHKLMRECAGSQENSLLSIESFCFEIIGAIADLPNYKTVPGWLKNAYEILQDCFAQELSIKSISQMVGVHPIHLTRSFQTFYHSTPGEFLRNRRLQKAAALLVNSKLSVAEKPWKPDFLTKAT